MKEVFIPVPEPIKPTFRTQEEVAPELGMTKHELRRYCKESKLYTKLSKNRIMLDAENIEAIVAWVIARSIEPDVDASSKIDPFA